MRSLSKSALVLLYVAGTVAPGRESRAAAADEVGLAAPARLSTAQQARARELGLDENGVLTLASIIEEESRAGDDPALLSAVLRNRLTRGWHLDSAASLAYAARVAGEPPAESLEQPYNTFRHAGLPPGPLCAPGAAAVAAALSPAGGNALVLFQDADGRRGYTLGAEEQAALAGVQRDPAPPALTRDLHYVVSNEWRQEQFRRSIEWTRGVQIGVGADQNYLLAGWARPDLLVLMDFDQLVVDLHAVYRVAFLNAPTPDAFVALWSRRRELRRLVREAYPPGGARRAALAALTAARKPVVKRLQRLYEQYAAAGVDTYLSDPEQYAHIAELYRTGRVIALRGDLTARRAMSQLTAVLRRFGRTVRVVYLSNAEQYFAYTRAFRANMLGLPTDAHTVLLRTRPTGLDYTYVVQRYDNFRAWLEQPHVRSVRALAPRRDLRRDRPLIEITRLPPPGRRARAASAH